VEVKFGEEWDVEAVKIQSLKGWAEARGR